MTIFRKVLLGTGGVIAVLAVIGLLLPRYVHVERAINIDAPRPTVFTVLNSFTHFNKWSPWVASRPEREVHLRRPGVRRRREAHLGRRPRHHGQR